MFPYNSSLRQGTGQLKRSRSQERHGDSNSVDEDDNRLPHHKRRRVGGKDTGFAVEDTSVIGVFSREAFENFGKTWRRRILEEKEGLLITEQSRKRARAAEEGLLTPKKRARVGESFQDRLDRQSKSVIPADFETQINALFKNKNIPHVIAVIEGKEEQPSLNLKTSVDGKSIALSYKKVEYSQGHNTIGLKDNKQSVNMYVRNDMQNAYSFSEEKITRGSKEIRCIGVNYKTTDGKSYRSLVVHIPNEFVGNDEEIRITHQAFEDYAKKVKNEKQRVTVTGYVGDTNYKKPFYDHSVPSMGGHLPNGDTLNPQSSGATKDTNFMQSIPVGQDQSEHSVLQPSVLNYIFPNTDAQNTETTDHPSFIHYTAHRSEISGRNPNDAIDYYS